MTQNTHDYPGLQSRIQEVLMKLNSKQYDALYEYVCADSQKEVSKDQYVKDLLGFDRQMKEQGIAIKSVVADDDTGFLFTNRASLKSLDEVGKMDTIDVTFHYTTAMTIDGEESESTSGQVWTFKYQNNQWCIQSPL